MACRAVVMRTLTAVAATCLMAATAIHIKEDGPTGGAALAGHAMRYAAPATPHPAGASHHIKTVFVILMENHNWSQIKGNASAPYINKTLLPIAAHADRYFNPPGMHPSLPNYLWLEAGTNFGVQDDGPPAAHGITGEEHLTTLLDRAGISWKSYQENIAGDACPLTDNYPYAVKHDPQVYFADVSDGNRPNSARCIAHIRPYTELAADLARNSVSRYNFITPSLCDDMHDACGPTYDAIRQGDTWLARNVPAIVKSRAYRQGGVVLITWDDGEGGDGPIGMIVLSPFARKGYAGSTLYTHSSTLRSVEEIFGVRPYLGDAAHAADLSALFTAFP
jgi:hypothetical protein